MTTSIYLDYAATTPVDPRVLQEMLPFFTERFGNPASSQHAVGRDAREAVERARGQVAQTIGADPREIVWTSGATESDNLALQGVALSPYAARRGNHVITVATEHRAVLDCCLHLESRGIRVTCLGVDRAGRVDLARLAEAISPDTILVSVMHGNNETGVLQPIRDIGTLCADRGVLFHTDATQTFGKVDIDVERDRIDLLSLSAHKLYGPKGVGALYVRRKGPRVRCVPLQYGGGHEGGLRSGTLNVPGIVGLGAAAEIARAEMGEEGARLAALRDALERGLASGAARAVTRNGEGAERLPGFSNLGFAGVNAEALMATVPELAVSSRAACSSATRHASHVLKAMGCAEDLIEGSIRFSLGRFTTEEEIGRAVAHLLEALDRYEETSAGECDLA